MYTLKWLLLSGSGGFAASKVWFFRAGIDTHPRTRRCMRCGKSAVRARKLVVGTGNYAGRWFELRRMQLRARETYREGLLNIRSQSRRSVLLAAGCHCELCVRMVILCFSPAGANLLGLVWEGNGKASNREKIAANGFCGEVNCEIRGRGGRGKLCLGRFVGRDCVSAKAVALRS